MKQFIAFLILCVSWCAQAAAPIGTNFSRYPNTNVAPASGLLLIAVTNETPKTNYNMLISDFLRQATNTAVITNWTVLAQPASANLTNWSLIPTGAMANVVSVTYITNAINNISNYINTSTLLSLQSNGVSVTTLLTNLNLLYGTGMVIRVTNVNGSADVQFSADVTRGGVTNIANDAASNRVVVLSGLGTTVSKTSTNGTNFYIVTSADELVPPDPANLILWVKPEGLVGFTNGEVVTTWPDSGLFGNNMVSPGGGFNPTNFLNQLNGWSGVWFDGSDRLQSATAATASTTYTMFLVFRPDSASGTKGILRVGNEAGGYGFYIDSGNRAIVHRAVAALTDSTATPGAELWSAVRTSGPDLARFFVNGDSVTIANDTASVNTPDDHMILGAFGTVTALPLTGYIFEALVWDVALSDLERLTVEVYLENKYNLLGGGLSGNELTQVTNVINGIQLWTNNGGFVQTVTNRPVSIPNTNLLGGLVATQDIRFLGHNSASNSLWVATNATTGEGEWRTPAQVGLSFQTNLLNTSNFLATSSIDVKTNQTMLILQQAPNTGGQWFVGTNGTPTTNEARSGFEVNLFWKSLRVGEVADGIHPSNLGGRGSNYWNNTNLAPVTSAIGSNVTVRAAYSSIGGGAQNLILTNSKYSVIAGGYNNFIDTNSSTATIGGGGFNQIYGRSTTVNGMNATISGGSNNIINADVRLGSFIGGGGDNQIQTDSSGYAAIVGGFGNTTLLDGAFSFLGGGNLNQIGDISSGPSSAEASYAVLCGGNQNISRGIGAFVGGGNANNMLARDNDYSVIVGGQNNDIGVAAGEAETKYAFVGGGLNNDISSGVTYGAIVGGQDNSITLNSVNAFIGGGRANRVGDIFGNIPGGVSNVCTVSYGAVLGNFLTVPAAGYVHLGSGDRTKRVTVEGATNATVGGLIISVATPVASAGASETNLISVTIPAHTLTNSGDRLTFRASGRFAATANGKDIKVIYGSETILDTSSQIVNSGAWTFEGEIIRTGNTSQSVNAEFHGAGVTLFTTAASLDLAQTNGIATVLKLTSTAAGDGDVTNRTMSVWKWVAP